MTGNWHVFWIVFIAVMIGEFIAMAFGGGVR